MSWICLNCETENPNSMDYCEVCSSPRTVSHNDLIRHKYDSDKYNYVIQNQYRLLCNADSGDAKAQYLLGEWFYEQNQRDCFKEEAVAWFRKSATQGNPDAQYCLARCYENGYGVERDIDAAITWYERAAPTHKKANERLNIIKKRNRNNHWGCILVVLLIIAIITAYLTNAHHTAKSHSIQTERVSYQDYFEQ